MGEQGYLGRSPEHIHQEVTDRETLKSMQEGNQTYVVLPSQRSAREK